MDTKPIEASFRVLGLEPGATLAEVKEAYRFFVQTFHEDKYPAHSPYKEKAHQKMIEINDAYEKLKTFFQENPSGQPAGGWDTDPGKQTDFRSGNDGEMDWQSWQKNQEDSWNSELKQWYEGDLARRTQAKQEEEKTRRQTIVNTTRIGLVIAFAYLVLGHIGEHNLRSYTNNMNDVLAQDKLQYDLATHGTASGAYAVPQQQIYAQDLPLIYAQSARSQREKNDDGLTGWFLIGFAGVLSWAFISQKGKAAVSNYIDGKSFAHAFTGR